MGGDTCHPYDSILTNFLVGEKVRLKNDFVPETEKFKKEMNLDRWTMEQSDGVVWTIEAVYGAGNNLHFALSHKPDCPWNVLVTYEELVANFDYGLYVVHNIVTRENFGSYEK